MPEIMPLQQWLKFTDGGITSTRSAELKAVDNALQQYHQAPNQASLNNIKFLLAKWQQKEGPGWKTSVRNKTHAIDTLYQQLTGTGPVQTRTAADMVALSFARDESRAIITDLFQGKQLQFKSGMWNKIVGTGTFANINKGIVVHNVQNVGSSINKLAHPGGQQGGGAGQAFRGAAGAVGGAAGQGARFAAGAAGAGFQAANNATGGGMAAAMHLAGDLLRELIPVEIESEVKMALEVILPNFIGSVAAAVTPWVGTVTTAGSIFIGAAKTLNSQVKKYKVEMHAERSLAVDEPQAAFAAMARMLERERNGTAAGLAISVCEFGGKLAGTLADGGTATTVAIGLAASVARLAMLVGVIVIDVMEKNEANKLMAERVVDMRLFEACPVMGAYMVCCVPTSVLCNSIFDNFYQRGMQDVVERAAKNHIQPLRAQAQSLVLEHRMYIPELQNFPGLMKVNEDKVKEMKKKAGDKGWFLNLFD